MELQAAFAAADLNRLLHSAHSIKGESSLFHISQVTAQFAEIESTLRGGLMPEADAVERARLSLNRLVEELEAILTQER